MITKYLTELNRNSTSPEYFLMDFSLLTSKNLFYFLNTYKQYGTYFSFIFPIFLIYFPSLQEGKFLLAFFFVLLWFSALKKKKTLIFVERKQKCLQVCVCYAHQKLRLPALWFVLISIHKNSFCQFWLIIKELSESSSSFTLKLPKSLKDS